MIDARPRTNGLDLELLAFNTTFKLKLQSYHQQIIYKNAELHIYDSNGPTKFKLEHNGLYDGLVYVPHRQEEVGWARITHIGGDEYDGVFTTDISMYHLRAISVYEKVKRDNDIVLESPMDRHKNFQNSTHILIKDRDSYLGQLEKSSHILSDVLQDQKNMEESGSPIFQINQCGVTNNVPPKNTSKVYQSSNVFSSLFKRAPEGCPTSRKYMVMAAAADCSYYAVYQSASKVLSLLLADWLAASKVYEDTFNVVLSLSKVNILQTCSSEISDNISPPPITRWNQGCRASYTLPQRLSDFSYWRGQQNDSFGLWHLMTACPTQPSVGIAWVSTLCQRTATLQNGDYTAGVGVSSIVPVEWKVVAHEIGHNFGGMHDCISATCQTKCETLRLAQCPTQACRPCGPECDFMNPLDTSSSNLFSDYSINDICLEIGNSGSGCLLDEPPQALIAGICGNGVKEGNEECDCGSACAQNQCCTSECKLKPGARCSDDNDSCCSNCQIMASSSQCRPSNGICDPAEFCDGINSQCPVNKFLNDGSSCKTLSNGDAQCASGQCTSRDIQCTGRGLISTVRACPEFYMDCKLYCQDDKENCFLFNGNMLDGTPCGETGRCQSGQCTGMDQFGEIIGWYKRNLPLAIPITIVSLLGIGMIIWAGISRCRHHSRMRHQSYRASGLHRLSLSPADHRNSHLSSLGPGKRLSSLPSAPVYEGHELETIRETSVQSRNSQNISSNWAGLQPFHEGNEYKPLPPIHTTGNDNNNDWTGLQWMENKPN